MIIMLYEEVGVKIAIKMGKYNSLKLENSLGHMDKWNLSAQQTLLESGGTTLFPDTVRTW